MSLARASFDAPLTLPTPARRRPRGAAAALAVIATLTLAAGVLLPSAPAEARFAQGGAGAYVGAIDWIDWGASGMPVTNGKAVTSTQPMAGKTLTTTCTLSEIDGAVQTYRPGAYSGDALDDLYNINGTGGTNRLVNALANTHLGAKASFSVSCTAALDGAPISIEGLVVADAESSNRSQGEYVQATPAQSSATWRIIERARTCTTNVLATVSHDKTLRLAPDAEQCSMRQTTGSGPMVIAFMEGATGASITVQGGGKSAIALGVVFDTDFGDAPQSYGSAASLVERPWQGGELPVGTTNVSAPSFTLGAPAQPRLRLGATVDADRAHQASADASGDDLTATDDEDAVDMLAPITAVAGADHTIGDVRCTGQGVVAGWLDWDRNGTFDADERSAPVACASGATALAWTVPDDAAAGASFLRLRLAPSASAVASPVGLSAQGEVEDHPVLLTLPTPPVIEAPIEDAPPATPPGPDAPPADDEPVIDAPSDSPAEDTPVEDVPTEEAPPTEAPAEDLPTQEAPAGEVPPGSPAVEKPGKPADDVPADVPTNSAPAPGQEAPASDPTTVPADGQGAAVTPGGLAATGGAVSPAVVLSAFALVAAGILLSLRRVRRSHT